jgi:hypothetical protein
MDHLSSMRRQPNTGWQAEIQPHQPLIRLENRSGGVPKALTLQHPATIRAAMAAGAIPPPLVL